MDRQMKLETVTENKKEANWEESVSIGLYYRNLKKIRTHLPKVEHFLDEYLDGIGIAKHCIDLNSPVNRAVIRVPYPSDPKPYDFQKMEVDKMILLIS